MKPVILKSDEMQQWRNGAHERSALKERIVKQYGDVMIKAPGGRLLAIVRDLSVEPPKFGVARAPDPESCQCSGYAGRVTGQHHPICMHRSQWEAEQKELAAQKSAQAAEPPVERVAQTVTPLHEALSETGRMVEAEAVSGSGEPWLISMSTGKLARPADDMDLAEARASIARMGVPAVVLDGQTYIVAPMPPEPMSETDEVADTIPPEAPLTEPMAAPGPEPEAACGP